MKAPLSTPDKSTNVRPFFGYALLTASLLSVAGCASSASVPAAVSGDPALSIRQSEPLPTPPPRDSVSYESR